MGDISTKIQKFIEIFIDNNGYVKVVEGLKNTVIIAIAGLIIGIIIGTLIATVRVIPKYKRLPRVLDAICSVYVGFFRGTPMVVQIMIAFNLIHMNLPTVQFGILNLDLSRIVPGIIVLSLNSGAYISESVRAGIESIPKGQIEAAYSLGIRPWNTMRYVVLPQAIKNILPALGNEFVTIIKDSSLLQTIGVMELWNGAQTVATTTYLTLTPLLFAAFYYLIVTTAMTALLKQMEKRLGKGRK